MAVQFFDFQRQINSIRKEVDQVISSVIDSGRFILGPNVVELEQEIASLSGVKFGIGVASGTDALHLALLACGIGKDDEVITTPFTFIATLEAAAYCGAKPVFVDIDPVTYNIDADKIEEKITSKTKAIMPVHLYGQPANTNKIMEIAKKHNLRVIEDAAQAIGAKLDNKAVCSFGDAGALSFFPTKNLGAFGDGGMILTNSAQVAEKAKVLRGHGMGKTYHYEMVGYNSRLDEMQAAILKVRLKYLKKWTEARRANAAKYRELLADVKGISLPQEAKGAYHDYNQFTIRLEKRDELRKYLTDKGIGAMVYYPLSLHLQDGYKYLGYKKGDLPESEKAHSQVLSLPIYPELTPAEIQEVCAEIKNFFA